MEDRFGAILNLVSMQALLLLSICIIQAYEASPSFSNLYPNYYTLLFSLCQCRKSESRTCYFPSSHMTVFACKPTPGFYLTYALHCASIHEPVTVLTTSGPASPLPSLAVPYTNHSSAKCANATPKVQSVISYTAGLSMWYAP